MSDALREATATIVAAYLTNNPLPADRLAPFIAAVHGALAAAVTPASGPASGQPFDLAGCRADRRVPQ